MELTIIKRDGGAYIDSREVAEMISKRHDHLLRDIRKYLDIIKDGGLPKLWASDFFMESSYINAQNKEMPCYLISKMGCEVIGNKLIGEKGMLFTIAYVSKFNEMAELEQRESNHVTMPLPRLGEINSAVRLFISAFREIGADPERIMTFLREIYTPLGIVANADFYTTDDDAKYDDLEEYWYTAQEIAVECGLHSMSGIPHAQAVSCILNEILAIGAEHKRKSSVDSEFYLYNCVQYDLEARIAVLQWLADNRLPDKIQGATRTYHVKYFFAESEVHDE